MVPRTLLLAASTALAAAAARPNIVLIITDDQDVEMGSLNHMPKLRTYLADEGATFSRMYAHVPVCCPSRSSLYTGLYQHNNHVLGNNLNTNCSSRAWQTGPELNTFPVHLLQGGYKTSFAGKYLNMYGDPSVGGVAHVPPGWTNWQGLVGNSRYYDYTLSVNGVAEVHGHDYAADYLTDLALNRTLAFLEANVGGGAPLFAMVSTPASHGPDAPAPQYSGSLPDVKAPRSPAYNATVPGSHWLEAVQVRAFPTLLGSRPLRAPRPASSDDARKPPHPHPFLHPCNTPTCRPCIAWTKTAPRSWTTSSGAGC